MSKQDEEDYKEQNKDGCATSYQVRMKKWFTHESLVKILYTAGNT